jgi:hypothetical protein
MIEILYERKKYTFDGIDWIFKSSKVSKVFANFLSQEAISRGHNPEQFKESLKNEKYKVFEKDKEKTKVIKQKNIKNDGKIIVFLS